MNALPFFVALASIAFASFAMADDINNFPEETFLGTLGEPFSPYFAQTFVALPGVATNLAIELFGPGAQDDDADFRLLITEVSGDGVDFHPTTVLFESDTVTFDVTAPETIVNIPLPDLALVPGHTYAFILDAFVTRDGLDGAAYVATNGTYPNGAFYFNQGFAGNTRDEHFAGQWYFTESIYPTEYHDLAFQLHFEESMALNVIIDIKPGDSSNRINLRSAGVVSVAILSSNIFDALEVDPGSIFLSSATVKLAGSSGKHLCHTEDVNLDSMEDLVCKIMTAEMLLKPGDGIAELNAKTFDGTDIQGTDFVHIVPNYSKRSTRP